MQKTISADIVVERQAIRLRVQHITRRQREADADGHLVMISEPCDDLEIEFHIKAGAWAGYSCRDVNPMIDDDGIITLNYEREYKGRRARLHIDANRPDMAEVKALFLAHKWRVEERLRREAEAERKYQQGYKAVLDAMDSEEPVETTEELLRRVSAEEAAQVAKEED